MILTRKIGRFSGVSDAGFLHRFCELLDYVKYIVVGGWGMRLLAAFDLFLLLEFVTEFNILGTGCTRLEAMGSWRFDGGTIGAHGGNGCL